jgi:hypothetical protein
MSTTVHESKEILLDNGTTLKTKPLKISLLRPFMKEFDKVAAVAEDNEKSIEVLLDCVKIAMKQYAPDIDPNTLEDILDLPTVYAIIEAASGVKLADANALLTSVFENN